ncbi:MAG TPA: DUF5666 domain-containing protein [Rhodopila sp.]|uniref:DUF5666 domain-containing protein n=1 Tax=Rhodopila sp. TaxID=2480087 RepID=UPI002C472426|nr:DUF5666 domain-containing protein [Rhodopila sp.]HVY15250.1 DUF5666 domain-containing protein [Rhodopila sp.]
MVLSTALIGGGAVALPVYAQTASARTAAPPTRVRGTIESVNAGTVVVKTRGGATTSVKLGDKTTYGWVVPISISAVKTGAYIGTAALSEPDGSLKALEIHVFPASMRGAGEGHRGWDLGANSSMTNGTIGSVTNVDGRTLKLTYKGGEQTVHVPPKTPIVTFEPATAAEVLKPGSHAFILAAQAPDGSLTALSVRAGKHGSVPPM